MSDQIAEQEVRRLLLIFLRIPNETWTDVFKLFTRRTLVQKISPICCRLKNICNRNVNSIHEIKLPERFNRKLEEDDPEANQQLEHLAGNDCQLASQFRISSSMRIFEQNRAILRHCIELFRGCQLSLYPYAYEERDNAAHVDECLTCLEAAKPFVIYIWLFNDAQYMFNRSLRHPTIWNCTRVKLFLPFHSAAHDAVPTVVPFLDWLHQQQPIEVEDNDGSSADAAGGGAEPIVRCLIVDCSLSPIPGAMAICWLINACIQNFHQSQGPKDRRRFVISFVIYQDLELIAVLDQFGRHHNPLTGETLLLEHAGGHYLMAKAYRLRRFRAEEAANGNEFYGKTFQRDDVGDDFVVNYEDGPSVAIE